MSEERMPDFGDLKMPGDAEEGWYCATISSIEQTFWEDGSPFLSLRASLDGEGVEASRFYNLETDKGERNEEQLRQLKALSVHAGLGTEGGYDLSDLIKKKVGVRYGMNKKGYPTIWETDSLDADREWLNEGKPDAADDVPF